MEKVGEGADSFPPPAPVSLTESSTMAPKLKWVHGRPSLPPSPLGMLVTPSSSSSQVWSLVCSLIFPDAHLELRQHAELRNASFLGTVVYVVEGHSWVQHLFLNRFLLDQQLPLASRAHGLAYAPFLSLLLWPLWWLLAFIAWLTEDKATREARERANTVDAVRKGHCVVLPMGSHQTPDSKGDAAIEARTVIRDLLELQRGETEPIYIAPISLVWNRRRLAPEKPGQAGALEWLFGSRTEPGWIRCVLAALSDMR